MGRFDPDPVAPSLDQQTMARIESTLGALGQAIYALSVQGPPIIPPYPVPMVNVEVPTETLARTLSAAMQDMFDAMPPPPVPPAPVSLAAPAVQSDEQITAFLDATARQSEVLEAMREKLTNVISSNKSHFDGRLRNDGGMVSATNPLAVTVGNDPATLALTPATASLTSASPLTISPSVGTNALRLWWVSVIPDPDNTDTGYATVAIGGVEVYRAPALAHRQRFDGGAGEDIVVTIVGAGTFLASVHYLEFTP
jgi:hypothetical protein